ncbi:helix-turn-helix domain-containing protein [Micromonospora craniellae]|uniref:helix-turn-helix domain-containing protein n=1 Tax=Micromonospora craniellae TaxID=2294034 RepID=UPI001CC7CF66|nr:helix-turn-helix domain-containing protein [Micromonospora craniellae]
MHPPDLRSRALRMHRSGATVAEVARAVGVPYPTVRHWCRVQPEPRQLSTASRCFRCRREVENPTDLDQYAYLLGLYLGDGHLVTAARVPVLRIACCRSTARAPNTADRSC